MNITISGATPTSINVSDNVPQQGGVQSQVQALLNEIGTLLNQGGANGTPAMPQQMPLGTTGSSIPGNTLATNTQPTPALPTGNDLTQIGSALQTGDAQKAETNFKNSDPTDFEAMQNALTKGDGNTATNILAKAVSSGKLSQKDGAAIGAQLQQTANAHGGGVINGDAKNALKNALGGTDVIAQGHMRSVGQVVSQAFNNAFVN